MEWTPYVKPPDSPRPYLLLHIHLLHYRLHLTDETLGASCGNHIRPPIRRGVTLSRAQRTIYGLHAKGCYTDTQRGPASYTETIYTLFGVQICDPKSEIMWNNDQMTKTKHLIIHQATIDLARAEIEDRDKFSALLKADVPDNWPPEILSDALPWFLQQLETNHDSQGWFGWYVLYSNETLPEQYEYVINTNLHNDKNG